MEYEEFKSIVKIENSWLKDNKHIPNAIDLRGAKIKETPKDLLISGWLNLDDSKIETIESGLNVGEWVSAQGCKSLSKLGPKIKICGNFNLISCESLKELPGGLFVGGDIRLFETNIKELPIDLCVFGAIDIRFTDIKSNKVWEVSSPIGKHGDKLSFNKMSEKIYSYYFSGSVVDFENYIRKKDDFNEYMIFIKHIKTLK